MLDDLNGPIEPAEIEARCAAEAKRIRGLLTKTKENFIKIGLALLLISGLMKNEKRFLLWLREHCHLSLSSAENMMRAAEKFGGRIATVANIDQTGLYELSRKSVSNEIREKIIAESQTEYLSAGAVRKKIAEAKAKANIAAEAWGAVAESNASPAPETSDASTADETRPPKRLAKNPTLDAFFVGILKVLGPDEVLAVMSPLAGMTVDGVLAYFRANQKSLCRAAGYNDALDDGGTA